MEFGTVRSIVGFYLSLSSILGSLFFIHLGTWYKDISTTEQKWMRFKHIQNLDKHIECYLEVYDEKSPLAAVGFTLLTAFMMVLGVFAIRLRSFIPPEEEVVNFLYIPLYLFFSVYLVGSLTYLILGYRRVRRLFAEIDEKLG